MSFLFFAIGSPVVGVGFTGTLATSRPKLGEHRYNFNIYIYTVFFYVAGKFRDNATLICSCALRPLANLFNFLYLY